MSLAKVDGFPTRGGFVNWTPFVFYRNINFKVRVNYFPNLRSLEDRRSGFVTSPSWTSSCAPESCIIIWACLEVKETHQRKKELEWGHFISNSFLKISLGLFIYHKDTNDHWQLCAQAPWRSLAYIFRSLEEESKENIHHLLFMSSS